MRASILVTGILIAKAIRPDAPIDGLGLVIVVFLIMDVVEWWVGVRARQQRQASTQAKEARHDLVSAP